MAKVRIIVGASLDRDAQNVFAPIVASAAKARKQVEKEAIAQTQTAKQQADKMAKDVERAARQRVRDEKQAAKEIDRELEKSNRAREREDKERLALASRNAKERLRQEKEYLRELERELDKHNKQQAKAAAAKEKEKARVDRVVSRGIGIAGQTTRTALSFGARVVGDIARSSGVNLDFGQMISHNVELEKRVTDLTNAAFMPGEVGASGTRQDPEALMKQLRDVATETGYATNDAAEGLQKFVAKTGDLAVGRDILKQMAMLSRATGASLEDMVDAAGDVANAMGDVPDKAIKVEMVMKSLAAQGKVGAVEIKDLAVQMAKLGAASGQFEGSPQEAMAEMGALVQMARAKGGAASATQAASSVAAFTNTFSKGARLGAFARYGIQIENSEHKIRNPIDIITDALRATGGDRKKLGDMFSETRAKTTVQGFSAIYSEAGGGEKGIQAVRDAFDELAKRTMKDAEMMDSFARSMATTEAKANSFNNQMDAIVGDMQKELVPAFVALAPVVIQVSSALAKLLTVLFGVPDTTTAHGGAAAQATVVSKDVKETKTQLAQGYIYRQQDQLDRQAEKDMQLAVDKQRDVVAEQKASVPGGFMSAILGGIGHKGTLLGAMGLRGGEYVDNKKAAADTAERLLEMNQKKLEEIRVVNAQVAEQLAKGIKVRDASPPKPDASARTAANSP